MKRSVAVLVCSITAIVLGATSAAADGGAGIVYAHSNVVQAFNSNSAEPVIRTTSAVAFDGNNAPMTDTNFAYAKSSNCTGCRSVAVAVQVVIVEGSPSNYQPQNAAVAVNDQCQSCQTFAYAHQYVIQTFHEPSYQNGSYEQLSRIQGQISQVAHSSEDFATMSSQLDQLSLQFYNVVYQAVMNQTHGDAGRKAEGRQVQQKD